MHCVKRSTRVAAAIVATLVLSNQYPVTGDRLALRPYEAGDAIGDAGAGPPRFAHSESARS